MQAPGHAHGSFEGSGPGLPTRSRPNGLRAEDLEWDPTWVCERIVMGPESLPEKNLARQHGGWGSESSGGDAGKSRLVLSRLGVDEQVDIGLVKGVQGVWS